MAELSEQFKKDLIDGKIDLEEYGMTVKLEEPQKWLDRTMENLRTKLGLSIIPPFEPNHVTATPTHGVVYQEPTSEPKYFDIETPLYLVKGKWQRWNSFIAMVDFWDKKAKEATDTLDIEFRDGVMKIK